MAVFLPLNADRPPRLRRGKFGTGGREVRMSTISLGAPPGSPGLLALFKTYLDAIGDEALNATGRVQRYLIGHWAEHPDDHHVTRGQVAKSTGLSIKSVTRAFGELSARGRIGIEGPEDPAARRRIFPLAGMFPTLDDAGGRDIPVPPGQICRDKNVPSYVERESASAPHVQRGGDRNVPAGPLTAALGRLEAGDPEAVEDAVAALVRAYGRGDDGFDAEPFYRKQCLAVVEGKVAVGVLIGATVEVAEGEKIRSPRKAWFKSIARRISEARKAKPPTPAAADAAPGPTPEPSPPPSPERPAEEARAPLPATKPADRWEAAPKPLRAEIEASVRAESPWLNRWGAKFRALCVAELGRRSPDVIDPGKPEVITEAAAAKADRSA